MQPNFLYTQLNLLKREVFHNFGNKLCVEINVLISGSTGSNFVQEFSEVHTDWEID